MASAAVARPLSHNVLVTDMTPAVANLLEESTIQSLRSVQHRDMQGNLISKFLQSSTGRGTQADLPFQPIPTSPTPPDLALSDRSTPFARSSARLTVDIGEGRRTELVSPRFG